MKHTDLNQHWIDQQDEFTGQNGIQPVTWAFCWRCGKKIAMNHKQELCDGVHSKCSTVARLGAGVVATSQLVLYISPDLQKVEVGLQDLQTAKFTFKCNQPD